MDGRFLILALGRIGPWTPSRHRPRSSDQGRPL